MELPGIGLFGDIRPRAKQYEYGDSVLVVADLDDIITSKRTADRTKDWRAMDALYEARDELRQEGDRYDTEPETIEGITGDDNA